MSYSVPKAKGKIASAGLNDLLVVGGAGGLLEAVLLRILRKKVLPEYEL